MKSFFTKPIKLLIFISAILLLTGCANTGTYEIPSDIYISETFCSENIDPESFNLKDIRPINFNSEHPSSDSSSSDISSSHMEQDTTSTEKTDFTLSADKKESEENLSEIYFSYGTDVDWHTPRLTNRQKYPFCINYLLSTADGETIYIASDLSKVHVVNAIDDDTQAVYQLEKPAGYLLLNQSILYCISTDTVEIWDTVTARRLDIITYQSSGLNEFYNISDAMLVKDCLYLLRGSSYIQRVPLSDESSEFSIFENGEFSMSETAKLEYTGCFLDSKNSRIFAKAEQEDMVYCLDLISGSLKTFESIGNTEFFVNDITGTLFMIIKNEDDNFGCSILCRAYDAEYNLLKETTWNIGDKYEGIFSSYIPMDVSADDKLILMQECYGNLLILNTEENNNCKFIENYTKEYSPTAFVNPECVFISQVDIAAPWFLYNTSTGVYQGSSEMNGYCKIANSQNGFVLYKTNGTVAVYSNSLPENITKFLEKPDLVTNPFNGGLWTEPNKDNITAISMDEKYTVKLVITEDEPLHYANRDFDMYLSYWMTDGMTGEPLYCIQFPTDSFVSLAVKDASCAAIINRAGVYYEFNPQNGEIYRSGMFDMPNHSELHTVQFVVDFEHQLASVIYKLSNFSYDGALYSTESFERVFDYGSADGYMKADLQCKKIYYRDTFSGQYLVMTLEKQSDK